jgi:hypothetical protein
MSKSHGTGQVQPMPRAAKVPGNEKSFVSIKTISTNIVKRIWRLNAINQFNFRIAIFLESSFNESF